MSNSNDRGRRYDNVNVMVKAEATRGRRRANRAGLVALRGAADLDSDEVVFATRNREVSNPFSWD